VSTTVLALLVPTMATVLTAIPRTPAIAQRAGLAATVLSVSFSRVDFSLTIEARLCARGRHWYGIFHYH